MKEEGLERWLHYDRWARIVFDCCFLVPENHIRIARSKSGRRCGAGWRKISRVEMCPKQVRHSLRIQSADWPAEKTFSFAPTTGWIRDHLRGRGATHCPWRCFGRDWNRKSSEFSGAFGARSLLRIGRPAVSAAMGSCGAGSDLRVVDEWQGISVTSRRRAQAISGFRRSRLSRNPKKDSSEFIKARRSLRSGRWSWRQARNGRGTRPQSCQSAPKGMQLESKIADFFRGTLQQSHRSARVPWEETHGRVAGIARYFSLPAG